MAYGNSGGGFMWIVLLGLCVAWFWYAPEYDLWLPDSVAKLRESLGGVEEKVVETVGEVRNVTTEVIDGQEVVLVEDRVTYECNMESPLTPVDYDKVRSVCEGWGAKWFLDASEVSCTGSSINSVMCYSATALELKNVCEEESGVWTCENGFVGCECEV